MGDNRTLEIPAELYERIERLAAVRETPVAYLLEDALALVEEQPLELVRPEAMSREEVASRSVRESAAIRKEEVAYRAMHSELFEKYAGRYVAVYNGELVDFDADESDLYRRIDKRYPNDVVLMKKVEKSPEKIYYSRSPRFIREV